MSETPDPILPNPEAAAAVANALGHMPIEREPSTFGKFIWGFVIIYACLVVTGELAYDGDFSFGKQTPTEGIVRACVKTFRAHPFAADFKADVTIAASPFVGADAAAVFQLLKDGGFTLTDETQKYEAEMKYNDGVIEATRDASRLWPEVLRHDSCNVQVVLKGNQVTGASAQAVRTAKMQPSLGGKKAVAGVLNAVSSSATGALTNAIPGSMPAGITN